MKNMRKGMALLLSFVILVGMMPMHVNATGTVPATTGETVPITTGATEPETTAETEPETTAETEPETTAETEPETTAETEPETTAETEPETTAETEPETTAETEPETTAETEPETTAETEPETTAETEPETTGATDPEVIDEAEPETTEETVPELVKVSCTGQYMDNGELIEGNDTISAVGTNLVSISAIWEHAYDDLLTTLYGSDDLFSPYAINVEGYVPGEPITIFVEIAADILLKDNIAIYHIDTDGTHIAISDYIVREKEIDGLMFTEVEFTTNSLGVFAIGNELVPQFWYDNDIDLYAAAPGMTAISAVNEKGNVNTGDAFTDYICYTTVPEGDTWDYPIYYSVLLPQTFDMDNLALYEVTSVGLFPMEFTVEGGAVNFEYPGAVTFACGVAAVPKGYPLTGLELTGTLPTDCFVGESVSLPDVTVTAVYAKNGDEHRKVLHPVASVEEDGYMVVADTGTVGKTTVYVNFGTATAKFSINVHQEKFEDKETGIRVDVDAFGTTGVSVEVLDNVQFEQSPLLNHVENFVAYDIDLTGYQQGDTAVVTLPIPEGVERPAVFYVSDDGTEVVRMPATVNGDGTVSFKTNHFSTYALGEQIYDEPESTSREHTTPDGETITLEGQTMTRPGVDTTETIWKQLPANSSLEAGEKYLIVNSDGIALGNNNGAIYAPTVTVVEGTEPHGTHIKADDNVPSGAVWTAEEGWKFKNGNHYLAVDYGILGLNHQLKLTTTSNDARTFSTDGQSLYYNWGINVYLRYTNNNWALGTGSSNLYFYKETTVGTKTPEILYSAAGTSVTLPAVLGHQHTLSSVLKASGEDITESSGITPKYQLVEGKGDSGVIDIDENGVASLSGKVGTAVVRVTYESGNLLVWDEFVIHTEEPEYEMELCQPKLDENGNTVYEPITAPIVKKNVQKGDKDNIWAVITANGEDIGQLNDAQLEKLTFVSSNNDIATVDPKTGEVTFHGGTGTVVITAVYEYTDGKSITDTVVFSVSQTQHVVPEDGTDDFPEYPNEGSIRYDKHATAVGNFADTGMVQLELSMTGVPFTTGSEIDVVIMLDMSTSMTDDGVDRKTPAIAAARQALEILVKNEDGSFNGNRVAIYGFNGWYPGTNQTDAQKNNYNSYHIESVLDYEQGNNSGENNYNISRIAPMQTYDARSYQTTYNAISSQYTLEAGTNYAAALKQCYLTLQNTKQEGRKQFVIFMTDGAASTGFAYVTRNNGKAVYNVNTLGSDGFTGIGTVVQQTEYYSTQMKTDDVEIYTVGVQISNNNAKTVLKKIAGTKDGDGTNAAYSDYAMTVDDLDKFAEAFRKIATNIRQAATDVKVTDKIADSYTMVFDAPNAEVGEKDGNQEYYIEVREYQLDAVKDTAGTIVDYARGSYDSKMKLYMGVNGNKYYAATAANSTGGKNKFAAPAFDTNPLGTLYYWTTDAAKGDSGISVKDANNKTYYFVSTGKGTHNMISGAYAEGEIHATYVTDEFGNATDKENKTSQDLIIAAPYFVYNANTRMLVWTADKLSSTELALSYFLYLDESGGHVGSLHETPAGTYETNEYAHLQYTNFQNNPCEQVFPVPQMTWNGAQVSYVFYLVNDKGQPVNRAGRVVPFSEAVYVTDVFTYSITWNELETSDALEANRLAVNLVPDVYELYDKGAAYRIHVYEDQNQANLNNHFRITKGESAAVNTTYVYNTKSDAVKYTTPGIHAENQKFLCRGEGKLNVTEKDGKLSAASYTPLAGEKQKVFTTAPHGNVFYDGKYAYFKGKDEAGNDIYYTIVEKNSAETVETGFDFSNTTVAFAVMWQPQLVEDTVVIDFGLDVVVEVAVNDALTSQVLGVFNDKPTGQDSPLINVGSYKQRYSNNAPIDLGITLDNKNVNVGKAYADSQNSVRVSLDKKTGMLIKDPLQFYYESEVSYYEDSNSSTLQTWLMYSSVTVIPATTIYYEDEYVTLSSETKDGNIWMAKTDGSGWDEESKAVTDIQSNDRPGENKVSELYDADNFYGYDPAYSECSTYSMGNAAVFTASPTKRGVATFEFYGTGFDVIAATSDTTGTIIVKLYPWENGAFSTREVASYIVDTYYGYSYDGTDSETGEPIWEAKPNDSKALYQVPVIKLANRPYGRYKAEIRIRYSEPFDHTGNGSYQFYLDAIRIYDPAGDDPTNETVKSAYEKDGESWPVYAELRNWIIDAGTYDTFTGDNVTGAVYIDGMGTEASVADYKNFGPNNEVYLANGQAVSFHLDGQNAKTVQLAMKSVGGTSNPQIWYMENGAAKEYTFQESKNLPTATDMYYDITPLKGKDVIIQNNGEAILSITNVKMTFAKKEDKPATAEETAQVMSVSRSGMQDVLMFLRTPRKEIPPIPEVPETTVPETTVPETTVPETTVPETTVPETTVPETTVPETTVPETTVPETTVPETTVPETTVPETTVPEATIPETTVPETTVPETTVPETTVPETTVPETTVPKNPTYKPSGNQSTVTKPVGTTPDEPKSTIAEATDPKLQISDNQEIVATEEPEQEQNVPPVKEQPDSFVKQDSPEVQKTVWEMIVEWFMNLINFIIGLFGGWQ